MSTRPNSRLRAQSFNRARCSAPYCRSGDYRQDPACESYAYQLEFLRSWWHNGAYNSDRFTNPGMLIETSEPINSLQALNNVFPTTAGFIANNGAQRVLSSYHTGGVQVCMGDGAVRFLSQNLNLQTLNDLGGMNDGNPLGEF